MTILVVLTCQRNLTRRMTKTMWIETWERCLQKVSLTPITVHTRSYLSWRVHQDNPVARKQLRAKDWLTMARVLTAFLKIVWLTDLPTKWSTSSTTWSCLLTAIASSMWMWKNMGSTTLASVLKNSNKAKITPSSRLNKNSYLSWSWMTNSRL